MGSGTWRHVVGVTPTCINHSEKMKICSQSHIKGTHLLFLAKASPQCKPRVQVKVRHVLVMVDLHWNLIRKS